METTFAEENFLYLLFVILTKALTRENFDRGLKHMLNPQCICNAFTVPKDISKCISIFSSHTELEKVYLQSWVLSIGLFLNDKTR